MSPGCSQWYEPGPFLWFCLAGDSLALPNHLKSPAEVDSASWSKEPHKLAASSLLLLYILVS